MNTIILGTSIKTTHDVEIVSKFLNSHGGIMRWSIDLLDWERVLKIVALNTIKYEESRIISEEK